MKVVYTKNSASVFLIVTSLFCAWGCAPAPKTTTPADRTATVRKALSVSSLVSGLDADWRCPVVPNVTLKDGITTGGYSYGGAGDYTVCVSRSDTSRFNVIGDTTAKTVCVYPMYYSSTVVSIVEAPQCVGGGSKSYEIKFGSPSVNYVVIVDSTQTAAFNACLSSGSRGTTPCPPKSEGFVQ